MTTGRGRERHQAPLIVEATQARAPVSLLTRHDESGVAHGEWSEDAPIQHRTELCAFKARDQESKQVGRHAVVKSGARLIDQRQPSETCNPLVRCECVVDLRTKRLRVCATDWAAMKVAIRETGAMRQQIAK